MKKHYRKLRLIFSAILVSISLTLFSSVNQQTIHSSIKWNGTEKWYADSLSREVVIFKDAQFPDNNLIPYYVKEVPAEKGTVSTAIIKNATYVPLSEKEQNIIGNNTFAAEPEVNIYTTVSRGSESTQIQVLPFVNKNGKILKLLDFDIELTQKSPSAKSPASTIHTYASNSVLASGKFVKIRIKDSGVYKLTYDDLNSMGIDPANVKIFGYGGAALEQNFALKYNDDLPEISIYTNKGADGVFNSGDYILFYAQGTVKWSFDGANNIFTHLNNPYSNYGYYFVTSDAGTGKKIEAVDSAVPDTETVYDVSEFNDYQLHEKDLFNFCSSGKEFYGEKFADVTSYNFTFSFPNIVTGNTSVIARLDAASSASSTATYNLSLNGAQTQSLSIAKKTDGDNYEQAKAATGIYSYTPNSDNLAFNITYSKPNSTAIGYLNYLEINARRELTMSGAAMPFQNTDYVGLKAFSRFHISNSTPNTQIWNITDPLNIKAINTTAEAGEITFTDSSNVVMNYLAIDPTQSSAFPKPEIVGNIDNQNLHGIQPVNMVIITHPDFKSQAETLAQAHRNMDGLSVAVVTTDQVYNEFSSGAPDATAYRWVMKMLYDRALSTGNKTDMPKYLLLFGRGSFDNRKLLNSSGDNLIMTYQSDNSLILTQSYVTDDYFGFLDDNEGVNIPANRMDIGVGRFPVTNQTDATNVVTKTINYMKNQDKGNWKNQICFVADDGDAALHVKQADSIAVNNNKLYPSYQINKIYLDAFTQEVNASGQSYPLAKTKLKDLINTGIIMFDYTGHAGTMGLANESILSINDVKSLTNNHLPIWVGATCDFLQFDIENVSAGEHVVTNLNGGGIGILSAARTVYASQNFNINKAFTDTLFVKNNGTEYRIGDVLMKAKNKVGTESNKLSYVYMGDPAVKLNYPTNYTIATTKINDDATLTNDTLKALSIAKVEGEIRSADGTKVSGFNGAVHIVVYDKAQRITTLNNEGDGAYTYTDRPNTLFSGKAEVKNGSFKFTFMLPKDIKYNFGSGRINYYAQDDVNNKEAQGYYEKFIVGGTSTNYYNESDGPNVKMYLNSENFVSGNKVNEAPLFIAQVNDTNGINTVGSGIGHDIVLTVDKDASQSYILNDYFTAETNSYTTGSVSYQLPPMEDGKHTLSFRVWDLLNNSTDKTIEFEVVKGLSPVIFNTISYPNPAVTNATIKIVSDRPQNVKSTRIDIYDLAGRHIWGFSQNSADEVTWDLSGADGKSIRPGAYLYKATITMNDGAVASKTNKIIVIKQ